MRAVVFIHRFYRHRAKRPDLAAPPSAAACDGVLLHLVAVGSGHDPSRPFSS